MQRDYVPIPVEYRVTLDLLSDEDFGKLVRALMDYAVDGIPIELEGDARFYSKSVMLKDDYYARRFDEEHEKAMKRSRHASTAAKAKHEAESRANGEDSRPSLPEQTISYQINSNQIISDQNISSDMKNLRSSCPEPCEDSEQQEEAVIKITLNDHSEYAVTRKDVDEWQELFPALDVMQQLRNIKVWCDENPKNRKTRSGVRRFISGWLIKEQNRARPDAQGAGGRKQGAGGKRAPVLTEF